MGAPRSMSWSRTRDPPPQVKVQSRSGEAPGQGPGRGLGVTQVQGLGPQGQVLGPPGQVLGAPGQGPGQGLGAPGQGQGQGPRSGGPLVPLWSRRRTVLCFIFSVQLLNRNKPSKVDPVFFIKRTLKLTMPGYEFVELEMGAYYSIGELKGHGILLL